MLWTAPGSARSAFCILFVMIKHLYTALHYIRHFIVAKRAGHGVHSPFVYRLCEQVFYNTDQFYVFDKLDQIRRQLLQTNQELLIEDYGAGSKTLKKNIRNISAIAANGISSKTKSECLFRLVQHLQLKTIIELGTSVGLNSLYLAAAVERGQVISIEGSASLHQFAKQLAEKNAFSFVQYVKGKFDDVLPEILSAQQTIDFVYIDGNHLETATLNYFELLLPHLHDNSVLVFDDIYWSKGMTKAWKKISLHPQVRLSLDLFSMGIVFFNKDIKEKQLLNLFLPSL